MRRSSEILEYLARTDTPNAVVLAPNAPPVSRSPGEIRVALNILMDAGDVYDTLQGFVMEAGLNTDGPLPPQGSFPLVVAGTGRFRVQYTTQRGSKAARISYIPFRPVALDDVVADTTIAQRLRDDVRPTDAGLIYVSGRDAPANAAIAYALIREWNDHARLVICTVERELTHLVAHANSIVIQSEVGADVPSFEQGIENALMFSPDVLYLGDPRPTDAMPGLADAAERPMRTIVTSVSAHPDRFLTIWRRAIGADNHDAAPTVHWHVRVTAPPAGPLQVTLHPLSSNEAHA